MKNRFIAFITVMVLILSSFSVIVYADEGNIVILFESDVHCGVDGYTKIAALRTEEQQKGNDVAVVSCGDFVQGGTLGAFSKGQYIIDIMNAVGYDVVTLGNHEFDYSIPVLEDLMDQLTAEVVSCNYVSLPDKTTVYAPYTILSFGDTDIAFVGITTPESITKTTPKYFTDENGEYLYDFCGEYLYDAVQESVDSAREDGADYVVALSHLGSEYVTERWMAQTVSQNTNGIDVFLDGHSHSIIESDTMPNMDNEDVLISSVGTKFEKIGKLTISPDGSMTTELIDTETYENTDAAVDEAVKNIEEEYAVEGDKVIGSSDVKLSTYDDDGNWIIRTEEANIGNFIADANRIVLGADIGLMNGGGIRADIEAGDVTYNNILAVLPWENKICMAEATGQMLLDMLEYSVKAYPDASGGFQHISGMRFSYDPSIETPVKLDEKGIYAGIEGERRVWSAEVLNKETNEYEAIDPDAVYTVASTTFLLKENGDGNTIFEDAEIIDDADLIDTSVIREYIQDYLGGTIGEEYRYTENRINAASKPDSGSEDESTSESTTESASESTTESTTETTTAASSHHSSGGGSSSSSCSVKFNTNGGSDVTTVRVSKNSTVKEPDEPVKDGCTFTGWYTDKDLTEPYDFDSKVTKSITLYAGWIENSDLNDVDEEITAEESTADETDWENPFRDVSEGDLYYDGIKAAYESGLMVGISDKEFAPDSAVTRAMFVAVLYRIEGEPEAGKSAFADVLDDAYYGSAAAWANENGIVYGVSSTLFAPDNALTKEQMAMIIERYAEYKGYDEDEDIDEIIAEIGSMQTNVSRAEAAEVFAELANR